MKRVLLSLLFVAHLIYDARIFAAEIISIDEQFQFAVISQAADIRYANDNETPLDLLDPRYDNDLSRVYRVGAVPLFNGGTIDIRFTIQNQTGQSRPLMIESRSAFIWSIDVAVTAAYEGHSVKTTKYGRWQVGERSTRLLHATSAFVPIELQPGESTLVVRLRPTVTTIGLGLHSLESAAQVSQLESIYGLMSYGGILVLIVSAIFIFLRLKDPSYLFYVLYAVVGLAVNATMTGWLLRAVEIMTPSMKVYAITSTSCSSVAAVLVGAVLLPFLRSFLQIAKHNSKLDQFLILNTWMFVSAALLVQILLLQEGPAIPLAIQITRSLGFYISLLPLAIMIYFARKKNRGAYFLLISFTPLMIGNIYWVTGMNHEIYEPLFRSYAGTFGMLVEMCLLSIGLGDRYRRIVIDEKEKKLIRQILPERVVQEKLASGHVKPVTISKATVVFVDIQDFTQISTRLDPEAIIAYLDHFFSEIDQIIEKKRLVKIKTIGDAYMFAGMNGSVDGDAEIACQAALEIIRLTEGLQTFGGECLKVRAGAHTGPIVAGVIGKTKFHYDIWGDTVNTAARLEARSSPGRLKISLQTKQELADSFVVEFDKLEKIKGKADMETYFVKEKQDRENNHAQTTEKSSA